MAEAAACPTCGAPLAPNMPAGLCPYCLYAGGAEAGSITSIGGGSPAETILELADVGERFAEYEVHELIGRGGMGAVFKATHKELQRVVAIKILPPETADQAEFEERFRREARALAALDHPNIVTLHDFGTRDGWFYFVMEYIDGSDLSTRIQKRSITTDEALSIVTQVCDALAYSHGKGVVHRDIKPANILIDRSGRIKIADFGLAKLVGPKDGDFELTRTNAALGTPLYMAPEQINGNPPTDHRADLYALGVVFYELLTGEIPVGRFDPPSKRTQGLGDHFDDVVLQAMRDEPDRRFQSATELKTSVIRAIDLKRTVPGGKRQLRRQFLLYRALPLGMAAGGVGALAVWISQRQNDRRNDPSISIGEPLTSELAVWYRERHSYPQEITGGYDGGEFTVRLDRSGSVTVDGDSSYGQHDVPEGVEQILLIDAAEGRNGAHILALRRDGRVFAWGDNTYEQCALPAEAREGIVSIAAGEFHSIALKESGTLVLWGHSREGAMQIPDAVVAGSVRMIAAGARFNLAWMDDGSIQAWGSNDVGQCNVPTDLDLASIESIGAHGSSAWVVLDDGSKRHWGATTP